MKEYVLKINEKWEENLNQLKSDFGQPDGAAILRLGVALLKIAKEARDKGNRVVVVNSDNNIEHEIVFPKG